jgi:ABC-type proline/glycine betaine transport system permease subunit
MMLEADSAFAEFKRRHFGWVAGAVVIAIVFGMVLGIDRERMFVASNDSPMMDSAKR